MYDHFNTVSMISWEQPCLAKLVLPWLLQFIVDDFMVALDYPNYDIGLHASDVVS